MTAPPSAAGSTASVTADAGQSNGTVNNAQTPSVSYTQDDPVVTKNSSLNSILQQLCDELGLDPPTLEVLRSTSAAYRATVSVKHGYASHKSHAKKADAQEDAASVALSSLMVENSAKNCRALLNEYCQQQRLGKPEYVIVGGDSGPFNCTAVVPIVCTSGDLATEDKATEVAAHGILFSLGRTHHLLRMIDEPRFEHFCVCSKPCMLMTARYQFSRPAAGHSSKKNAEKAAAERALSVLYPQLDPRPALDHCKNRLQELFTAEKPKYVSELGDDSLFYSEVSVSFIEQLSSTTELSPLSASDHLAKRVLTRLGLVS